MSSEQHLDPPEPAVPKARGWTRSRWLFLFAGILLLLALAAIGRATLVFQRVSQDASRSAFFAFDPEPDFRPFHDPRYLTVLMLGIRGAGDPEGGLLTDTVMVASVRKQSGDVMLVSLPRDLLVRVPGRPRQEKLNAVYALGLEQGGKRMALEYARVVAERVVGIKIDHALSIDLELLREVVDALDGVPLTLAKPFVESKQWALGGDMGYSKAFVIRDNQWVFELPAGTQVLDGATALYYVRARYSSNDFDRERRQQELLLALRERAVSLGMLANPLRVEELLRALERRVVTDIPLLQAPQLAGLLGKADRSRVRRLVLDTSPEGFLESRLVKGSYVLVPKAGNFSQIRQYLRRLLSG